MTQRQELEVEERVRTQPPDHGRHSRHRTGQTIQPALDLHYGADELRAIEGALIGSIPPDEMLRFLNLMLPAMNPGERVALLQGPRQGMPPAVFQDFLSQLAPSLASRDFEALKRDLAA